MTNSRTVNVENINKMIAAIKAEKKPIFMGNFVHDNGCGTTACLAGWANILRLDGKGEGWRNAFEDTEAAADWLGIDALLSARLFYDFRADMLSHENRKAVTLHLLETLRDTGYANWADSLRAVVPDKTHLV